MARIDDLLAAALRTLPPKPDQTANQRDKGKYGESLSKAVAQAFAEELRLRGMKEARPGSPGGLGLSGAERRMAGGIGAKRVDVTWATEESGLLLAVSVKTILFRDKRANNFQKNLTNRRGDMLFEAVTLHRRFPYAVLAGVLFFDADADQDGTGRRSSTFVNAHARFRLFTERDDPSGRDEQFEKFYIVLVDCNPFQPTMRFFRAGVPQEIIEAEDIFKDLVQLLAERNSDFYEAVDGVLHRVKA